MLSNPCFSSDLVNGAKDRDHNTLPPVVLDWETLPPLEQKRQQAIQDLIRSEDNYLTDLKFGIERYLMPLKGKDFFTEDKHEKLFNNLKEGLNSLHPYNPECNPSTTPEPGDGDSIRAVPKRPEGGPPRIQSDAEHPRSHGIPPGSPGTTRSVQHPPATSGTHGEFAVPVTGGA
eukprot:sb/3472033/